MNLFKIAVVTFFVLCVGLSCIVSKESFIKGDVCNPSNVVTFNGNELIAAN